jgi:hypothetical protein
MAKAMMAQAASDSTATTSVGDIECTPLSVDGIVVHFYFKLE